MGGYAETVSRTERLATDDVRVAEGPLEDEPAFMNYRDHAARLLRVAQLVLEPLRDVIECGF